VKYPTLEEILILHDYQIKRFGGKYGVRDIRMLESAIQRPQATFDGKDLYPTLFQKASAVVHSIIKNHPFVDGNKRTGIHAALTFLGENGIEVDVKNKDIVKLGLDISNDKISLKDLAGWFEQNQTKQPLTNIPN
jgi:death-on-curing protein